MIDHTHKTIDHTHKTIDHTHKTIDHTHKTIGHTNIIIPISGHTILKLLATGLIDSAQIACLSEYKVHSTQ